MMKEYYYFKKLIITKGIDFYRNDRIKFNESIKTYKDFAEMVAEKFLENNDEFFLEAIEYEAEMGWKSHSEVLKEFNDRFHFVDFEIDLLLKSFLILPFDHKDIFYHYRSFYQIPIHFPMLP